MAEIDPVVLRLIAENRQYIAGVEKAGKVTTANMTRNQRDVQRLERQFKTSSSEIARTVKTLAATLGVTLSVRQLQNYVDGYTRFSNQLKVAGLEGANLAGTQRELLDLSSRYGANLEALGNLYGKATQAGNDLGASQSQILSLTEATSQSLLITGTSTQQATGAILGLTQALSSEIVRAEEFNQINEGGLRPLLQAAAASEEFGGSIGKLRNAVVDGELSSRRFFELILEGSQVLEGQAANATLTLSGAFESLNSNLIVYIGEAAESNGVTEALAIAIQSLADNLDRIIPALAVIAAVMGGRFLASAVASSAALRALIAHLAIATTSMAGTALAARSAGAALLAAFGGPIGVAVLALGAGLAYVALEAENAEDKLARLSDEADRLEQEADAMESQLRAAGITIEKLSVSSVDAAGGMDALSQSMEQARRKAKELEDQAGITQLKLLQLSITRAQDGRRAAEANIRLKRSGGGGGFLIPADGLKPEGERFSAEKGQVEQFKRQEAAARRQIVALTTGLQNGINLTGDVSGTKTGPSKVSKTKKPSRSSRSRRGRADRSAEIAERAFQEQSRLDQEVIQAKIRLATNSEDRADLEFDLLALERDSRIAEINGNKDLSERQKAAQLAIIDELYGVAQKTSEQGEIIVTASNGLFQQIIQQEQILQATRDQADIARAEYEAEKEALEDALDVAVTQKERREILLDLVDLEFKHREAALQAVIAAQGIADTEKERAQIALDALRAAKAGAVRRAERDSESPGESFLRQLREDAKKYDENIEAIAVDGLQSLNDQLADAIVNSKNLGDVFSNVAKQIIADLLRIAIQQAIIRPLAENLFGGLGGASESGATGGGLGGFIGGLAKGIGGLFGRSSGGFVAPGQLYRVNEGSSPGRVEGFVPSTGGEVIPLGQMNVQPASGAPQQSVVRLYVQEGTMFEPRVEEISGNVSVQIVSEAAKPIVESAVSETLRRTSRPRL